MAKKEQIHELHIGKMVAAELERQGRRMSWFADQLHCDVSNAYKIIKRTDLDVKLLMRISKILEHNFLKDLLLFMK